VLNNQRKDIIMDLLKSSTYAINKKNKANGLDLLANINDKTVATALVAILSMAKNYNINLIRVNERGANYG
jgi:GTP-sensing pleiotropic transcriptional regulator CodY